MLHYKNEVLSISFFYGTSFPLLLTSTLIFMTSLGNFLRLLNVPKVFFLPSVINIWVSEQFTTPDPLRTQKQYVKQQVMNKYEASLEVIALSTQESPQEPNITHYIIDSWSKNIKTRAILRKRLSQKTPISENAYLKKRL